LQRSVLGLHGLSAYNDDNDQAAQADKWTNGKLFHWDRFFGRTSG